jgi:hypothetical protein
MTIRTLIVGTLLTLVLYPAHAQQQNAPPPLKPPSWPQKLTLQGPVMQTLGIQRSVP